MREYPDLISLRHGVEVQVMQGPFEDVARRARRVRWRAARNTVLTLGAVAAAVALLSEPTRSLTEPPPPPPPTPGPDFEVHQVAFTDPNTGYVLLGPCYVTDCGPDFTLARTTDGGRTWHQLPAPLRGVSRDSGPSLAVFDDGKVLLQTPMSRSVSRDGGRTWVNLPAQDRPGAPVDHLGTGSTLATYCPDPLHCQGRLAAYGPDGVLHPLTRQPDAAGEFLADATAASTDDRIWTAQVDNDRNLLALYYTEDRGRTWTRVDPPDTGENGYRPGVLAVPGVERIYLVGNSREGGDFAALWRLDEPDGDWLPLHGLIRAAGVPLQRAQILPSGELRITDQLNEVWHTEDGGARMVQAPTVTVDGASIRATVQQVIGGVLIASPISGRRADRLLFSADSGRTWLVRPVAF